MKPMGAALTFLLLSACSEEVEVSYVQFNATGESLTIQVGDASLLDSEASVELTSTTGSVVVGQATVTPAGGPVGTEHELTVEVFDDYENQVDRVSVRTDSGERGEDEYDLIGDSADEGFWKISLLSAGEADEVREDTFTIRLWESTLEDTTVDTGS